MTLSRSKWIVDLPKVTIQTQDVVDSSFVASDNVGNFLSNPTLLVAQDYNLFSKFSWKGAIVVTSSQNIYLIGV